MAPSWFTCGSPTGRSYRQVIDHRALFRMFYGARAVQPALSRACSGVPASRCRRRKIGDFGCSADVQRVFNRGPVRTTPTRRLKRVRQRSPRGERFTLRGEVLPEQLCSRCNCIRFARPIWRTHSQKGRDARRLAPMNWSAGFLGPIDVHALAMRCREGNLGLFTVNFAPRRSSCGAFFARSGSIRRVRQIPGRAAGRWKRSIYSVARSLADTRALSTLRASTSMILSGFRGSR